jgi:molybdopterin synthase sulfur carrier subunit
MKVFLPSPLAGYSAGRREVEASGATLAEALADLDRQFPGIAFRVVDEQGAIRPHIKFFVNREMVRTLSVRLGAGDEILVVAALSGG